MGRKGTGVCTGFAHLLTREPVPGCGRTIRSGGWQLGKVKGDVCRECYTQWREGTIARLMDSLPEGLSDQFDLAPGTLTRLLMYEYDPLLWKCESMIRNAQTRPREYTLLSGLTLVEAAWKLYRMIPERCPYLGVEFDGRYYEDRPQGAAGALPNSPSLDRIDSSRGYHWDNIQVISFLANRIKTNATDEELSTFSRNWLKLHS